MNDTNYNAGLRSPEFFGINLNSYRNNSSSKIYLS